jgi:hypothetical protein
MTTTQQPTIDQIRADVRAACQSWLGEQRAANVSQMTPGAWLEIADDVLTYVPCRTTWAERHGERAYYGLHNGARAAIAIANTTEDADEARAIMGEPIEYGECPQY